jgi:hypothetical protein
MIVATWPLNVEGSDVNREVHANSNDFRVRIVAPGYSAATSTPVSRVSLQEKSPGPVFVENGIAHLGTFVLRKVQSPPPAKDFTTAGGVLK